MPVCLPAGPFFRRSDKYHYDPNRMPNALSSPLRRGGNAMPGPYEAIVKSMVKACRLKDKISQPEAEDSLQKLRSKPESRDLAHALELILKGARVRDRLLVMVDQPEDITMIKEVLRLIEGEAEFHLDVAIVNGTRKFDIEERERIRRFLTSTPRAHLLRLRMIRAEISSENWLGRYLGDEGLIELNRGWTNGTLAHEMGHVLFDTIPAKEKDDWSVLHAKSKNAFDFVD